MNDVSLAEANNPPHTKSCEPLEVPKICFSSPTPGSSPCGNKDGNDESVGTLKRHHVERKTQLKRKLRYPLIVGKLTDEAKKVFRFRNKGEKDEHSKNKDSSSLVARPMDTLSVPRPNLIRKSTTSGMVPKVHKKLDINNKPYFVLQDAGLSNLLYYNQPKFSNRKPLNINKTSESDFNNATMIFNRVNGHLTDQLDKLERIELPNSQSPQKQNNLSASKPNPAVHTRAGWMSPAPYTGKEEGRRFSYNFV